MAKPIYHSSIEGAQHGSKGLEGFLAFSKEAGACLLYTSDAADE